MLGLVLGGLTLLLLLLHRIFSCSIHYRICIEELAGSLEAIPLQDPSKTRSYLGFDISPKQLPVISKHNIIYKIHDAKERFPPEHRGRFDVVHVRVLVLAVKEVEIARVVMNLIELLSECLHNRFFNLVDEDLSFTNPQDIRTGWLHTMGRIQPQQIYLRPTFAQIPFPPVSLC